MPNGFQSSFVADAFTQRQIFVERAKTALNAEHTVVTVAVVAALLAGLSNVDNLRLRAMGRPRLAALVRGVLAAYDTASAKHLADVTSWLEQYSNQEAEYVAGVMNETITDADARPTPAWPAVAAGIIGATGFTPAETLRTARLTYRGQVKKLIQRAFVQNWTPHQLINAFRGTRMRRFKDGLVGKLNRAMAATVDTVVQFGMSAARTQALISYLDWTIGYTWVSTLDAKTSTICRSLSGRVFKPGGPIPPIHYRCRSHIMPIFRRTAKLNPIAQGAFTAGETYYKWLKRQPLSTQEDVLGQKWSKLFNKGGLSTDEFAAKVVSRTYDPLTLDEMKRRSPDVFRRAGI